MGNTLDLTTIANAIIALAAAIITTFIIPWIKSKTTANQRREIVAWASIAVKAAEQIYNGPGRGDEKKRFVLNYLKNKGYSLDEKSLEIALEAAVKEINDVTLWQSDDEDEAEEDTDNE